MAALLAFLLILFGLGGSSAAGGTASAPALSITSVSPVRVSGHAFRPAERVRVVVTARHRVTKTVHASSRGSFTVVFASLTADPCSKAYVIARGSAGSRAQAKLGVRGCPPPEHSGR